MIKLSKHAEEAVGVRQIALAWIEATIAEPDHTEPDPNRPNRTRSFKAISEFGGRFLRVVHRPDGNDILVITAHFDRGFKP
jgi:hypothetical protein